MRQVGRQNPFSLRGTDPLPALLKCFQPLLNPGENFRFAMLGQLQRPTRCGNGTIIPSHFGIGICQSHQDGYTGRSRDLDGLLQKLDCFLRTPLQDQQVGQFIIDLLLLGVDFQ